MVLSKILDQCLSSYHTLTKSIKGFGNNEVFKTLTHNFNIVDSQPQANANGNANANADTGGSTIALRERCSGELKMLQQKSSICLNCSQGHSNE